MGDNYESFYDAYFDKGTGTFVSVITVFNPVYGSLIEQHMHNLNICIEESNDKLSLIEEQIRTLNDNPSLHVAVVFKQDPLEAAAKISELMPDLSRKMLASYKYITTAYWENN